MSKDKDKRSDEEVLVLDAEGVEFDVPSHGKIRIKPWTMGEYVKLSQDLEDLFRSLDDPELDVSLLQERKAMLSYYMRVIQPVYDAIEKGEEIPEISDLEHGKLERDMADEMRKLILLFARISDKAVPIIAKTTGLTKKNINNLSAEDALRMFVTIYVMNWNVLGNAYALFGNPTPGDETQPPEDSPSEE